MNKRDVVYVNAPPDIARALEGAEIIEDFLPPPDELVFKTPKVKITMSMSSTTIDTIKNYARKHNLKYQTMINDVVDKYANRLQTA